MTRHLFWISFRLYLSRAVKDWMGWAIYIILPIGLVVILSMVGSSVNSTAVFQDGYNVSATRASVAIVLMFQLLGGGYLLHYFTHDLLGTRKWRLRAAPCPVHNHIFAGITACTIFTVLQGLFIVAATAIFLDAYWGNWAVTALSIMLVSIIAQLVNIVLLLIIKNADITGFLSWAVGYGMTALAGVFFALPDNAFFAFMQKYGTPVALAKTAIMESGKWGSMEYYVTPLAFTILLAYIVCLAALAVILGRRKLI
ncbi:hypothetical protein [Lacrimispora sp.]|uniref:hypothetical protein n=1 Tax=Lacrimispora sp. TaxID=2719234 RepID=UPI00345F3459